MRASCCALGRHGRRSISCDVDYLLCSVTDTVTNVRGANFQACQTVSYRHGRQQLPGKNPFPRRAGAVVGQHIFSLSSYQCLGAAPAMAVDPGLADPEQCRELAKRGQVYVYCNGVAQLSYICFLATLLTNLFFDGMRADLTKAISLTPAFQVTHSFALASQTSLPNYNFGAVFANNAVSIYALACLYLSAKCFIRFSCKEVLITKAR